MLYFPRACTCFRGRQKYTWTGSLETGLRWGAGKIERVRAATGSFLFLGAFMYAFWRIGIYWPGVPSAEHGIFQLKQVPHGARFWTVQHARVMITNACTRACLHCNISLVQRIAPCDLVRRIITDQSAHLGRL